MISECVIKNLSQICPLSDGLIRRLSEVTSQISLKAKTVLLQPGKICEKVFFIENGFARAFYNRGDQEITSWFMGEGDVIVSVHSFFAQKPSFESIELLEDSILTALSYAELQLIYQEFIEFNMIGRVLTEKYYMLSEERTFGLRLQTTEERYVALLKNHPEIFNRAPLKHVASYLGMMPETLSRLRAKVRIIS